MNTTYQRACGDHDYAPLHRIPAGADTRIKVKAQCGVSFRPVAIWAPRPAGDGAWASFLRHHGCKRCNAYDPTT